MGALARRDEWLTWFSCWTTFRLCSRVTFSFIRCRRIRWPSKFSALNYFTDDRVVGAARWQCWCLRRCGDIRRTRSSSNVRTATGGSRRRCLSRIGDIIRLGWFRFFVQRERWPTESWAELWTQLKFGGEKKNKSIGDYSSLLSSVHLWFCASQWSKIIIFNFNFVFWICKKINMKIKCFCWSCVLITSGWESPRNGMMATTDYLVNYIKWKFSQSVRMKMDGSERGICGEKISILVVAMANEPSRTRH